MTLDTETYNKVRAALDRARRNGLDEVELLDKLGLLLTPERKQTLHAESLRYIYTVVTGWRPVEILRRKFLPHHSATATDMYSAITEFIEEVAKAAAKE